MGFFALGGWPILTNPKTSTTNQPTSLDSPASNTGENINKQPKTSSAHLNKYYLPVTTKKQKRRKKQKKKYEKYIFKKEKS